MLARVFARKWLRRTMAGVLALFLSVTWITAEAMRRPRWFADPARPGETPARMGWAAEDIAVTADDGTVLRGWFVHEPRAAGRTVIVLHGICADKGAMLGWADVIRSACRANVCLMDLRGHGESGGSAITYGVLEKGDVRAVFDHLASRPDVDAGAIAVAGTSLGGAIALQAAADDPRIAAVIAEGAFTSLADAVQERADRFHVPGLFVGAVRWCCEFQSGRKWDEVDLRRDAARIGCPVLLLHGEADDESACRNSVELHRCCPAGRVELWLIPRAGHVDAYRCAELEYGLRLGRFWGTPGSVRIWEQWAEARRLTDAALAGPLTPAEVEAAARLLRTGEMMPTRLEAISALALSRRPTVRGQARQALAECSAGAGEFDEVRRYASRVLAGWER